MTTERSLEFIAREKQRQSLSFARLRCPPVGPAEQFENICPAALSGGSIEDVRSGRGRVEGACESPSAFRRVGAKSLQTAVFLDWSRCWKSGSP